MNSFILSIVYCPSLCSLVPHPATKIQPHEGSNLYISCPLIHPKNLAHNEISVRTTCQIYEHCGNVLVSEMVVFYSEQRWRLWRQNLIFTVGCWWRGLEIYLSGRRASTQGVKEGTSIWGQTHQESRNHPQSQSSLETKWCEHLNTGSAREIQAPCLHSEHSAFPAQGYMLLWREPGLSQTNLGSWPTSWGAN